MLVLILETEGYEVGEVANGFEALQLDPDWRPDVILLDLMMPVMDGQEFLARRSAVTHLATAPVIIVTADSAARAWRVGTDICAVVMKPHDIQPLLELIKQNMPASLTAET
jgi:CheY-like chemotaxis protein